MTLNCRYSTALAISTAADRARKLLHAPDDGSVPPPRSTKHRIPHPFGWCRFPQRLQAFAREKYGFFDDDFDHRLVVDTGRLPAKQLTLRVENPHSGKEVRQICEDMSRTAEAEGFAGLIQSEYVMNELLLQSQYTGYQPSPFPFYVHMRKVDPVIGRGI